MTDEIKILLALQQIDNVMELVKGNIRRQLTCLQHSAKIKE